jgi:sortase (surface protein transpeptidase)
MVVFGVADALVLHEVIASAAPFPVMQANIRATVTLPPGPSLPAKGTGAPVRLTIPRIGVDAAIEKVALAKDDSMGIPKDPMDAGWYALGPRPGETGSAVIDGHVNWWYGATGVFKDLHLLKPGDTITVQDDSGADVSFTVREIHSYAASADAIAVFHSDDGKAHLNLITCDGVWVKMAGQYSERLVVFADKTE